MTGIIQSGQNKQNIPSTMKNKTSMFTCSTLFYIVFTILEEKNERKKLKTEKKEGKISPFAGILILYLLDPEDPARRF